MIFSYHFSPPTDFLRLNGANCDMVTVRLGNDTASVESWLRCVMLAVADRLHFVPGKRYVMLTVDDFVFSVNELL